MPDSDYKTCSKCGKEKPVGDFNRHVREKDGLQPYCRKCNSAYVLAWQRANPKRRRAIMKRHEDRHPDKMKARRAIGDRVFRGVLEKPCACEKCGEECPPDKLHAHHEDHARPLDIEWLCLKCHQETHGGEVVYQT